MTDEKRHIVIVAGEASGDLHAAHLVKELKALDPTLSFSGLGGKSMQAEGVELYADLTELAVVGFVEVLKNYRRFKILFDLILTKIKTTQANAVILVDYPGFNLRLAKALQNSGVKVIYYISPQVWAWKEKRVEEIRKYVDRMIVLFPFEKDFYARHQIDVSFVGHPLVDTVTVAHSKEEVFNKLGMKSESLTIGLLPGSREREVETLLPIMIDSAARLHKEMVNTQFLLMQAPTISRELIDQHLKDHSLPLHIKNDGVYDGINACDYCLVASGTATLEAAILGKPMVVIYKTHFLTWLLAKAFVKIPDIALVNVVAHKRIVPECVQFKANAATISHELLRLMKDDKRAQMIKEELQLVKNRLGEPGASRRAAEAISRIHF